MDIAKRKRINARILKVFLAFVAVIMLIVFFTETEEEPDGSTVRSRDGEQVADKMPDKKNDVSMPQGLDVRTLADGSLYSGEVNDDGQPHGQGVMIARRNGRDISRYEGGFRDGLPHGQGIKTWRGSRYEGEWRDGKEHGRGVMDSGTEGRYEGEWQDGKEHGQGIEIFPNGAVYEGEFRDGWPSGQGVDVQPDGRRSEGEWENYGLLRGVVTYPDGRRTAGEFEPGGLLRRGTLMVPDGQVLIKYNKESGIMLSQDGQVLRERNGIVHAGDLHDGLHMLTGGSLYEGEVNDDGYPHGLGILMSPDDGTLYVGELVNGVAHGLGVRVMPDGRRVAVEMSNGVLAGN